MLSTSIECVLFDLDGTLVDTAPDFIVAIGQLVSELGRPPVSDAQILQTVSDGARALTSLALGIDEQDPQFQTHNQRLLDCYYAQIEKPAATLYPNLDELLLQLEEQEIAWGIVTNKPEKYAERLLSKMTLRDRCKALVCPDHVSMSKPNPEGILLACEQLNAELDRTVYIGDHHRDIQAAKNADVIAIAAAYGYLTDSSAAEQWYADFIVQQPAQILPLLNRLKFA